MTHVIVIAQRKGGAGKTTLSCQLTAALLARGERVLGIDADEQQSFTQWAAARAERRDIDDRFLGVNTERYGWSGAVPYGVEAPDVVIVDTPPRIDGGVRRALRSADLVLTPLQLSPIDLDASVPTAQAINAAGKKPLFVVNRAPARARIADEIRAQISKYALPVAATELGNRAAFAESVYAGAGVIEIAKRSPAAVEIEALTDEVLAAIGRHGRAAA